MKIRVGDIVKVLRGKDAGHSSVVERVYPKSKKVLIKGVNEVKRHLKVNDKGEGGIVTISKPLDASKVMVVCPDCGKPTRIGYKVVDGKKVRFCKKCSKVISNVRKSEAVKVEKKVDGEMKAPEKVKKDKIKKESK